MKRFAVALLAAAALPLFAAPRHKTPAWQQTVSEVRDVSTAIQRYALDHDFAYPDGDYASLEALVAPAYLKTFPAKDPWRHAYAYVVSPDHNSFRIVSAGADGTFEPDSRTIVVYKKGDEPPVSYRNRLEDDVIWADTGFLQMPAQAKPR